LIFGHTYLLFKDLRRTYFCEIYVILWDLIKIKKPSFSVLEFSQTQLAVDQTVDRTRSQSTEPVDRCTRGTCTGQPK